jgi:phospholipid transport system transporter-binding protein
MSAATPSTLSARPVTVPAFALPNIVTAHDAGAVLARLAHVLTSSAAGAAVVVDAGALQRFDSSALALLLQARRLAQAQGRTIDLRGLPPRLAELARLYGVAELIA